MSVSPHMSPVPGSNRKQGWVLTHWPGFCPKMHYLVLTVAWFSCRELTRPAIIKRDGVMIQPLKYSKPLADQKLPANNAERKKVAVVSGGMPKKSKR